MRTAKVAVVALIPVLWIASCKRAAREAARESALWRQEVEQMRGALMTMGEDMTNSLPGGWINKIIADIAKGDGPEALAAYQALENIQRAYKGGRTAIQGEWNLRLEPLMGLRPNEAPVVAVFPVETNRLADFRAALDIRGMLQFDKTDKGRVRGTSRPRVADDVWRDVDANLRQFTHRMAGNPMRVGGGYGTLRVNFVFDSLLAHEKSLGSFAQSRRNLEAAINLALDTLVRPLERAIRALYSDQPVPIIGQTHREVSWDLNGPEQYAWIVFRKDEFERAFDDNFQLQVTVRLATRPDSVFAGGPSGSRTGITLDRSAFCTRRPSGACELQTIETEREGTLVYGVAFVGPRVPLTEAWLQRRAVLTDLRRRYEEQIQQGDENGARRTFQEFLREIDAPVADITVDPAA